MNDKTTIHQALLAFFKDFDGAHKTGKNPHFKSDHFTLDDVTKATKPILAKHGLYATHMLETDDKHTYVATCIFHESGEFISSKIPLPLNANPQAVGSAITYYKRYNLCALLGVSEADDDGNAAAAGAAQQQEATKEQWDIMEALAEGNLARAKHLANNKNMGYRQANLIISRWEQHDEKLAEEQAA